MVKFKKYNNDYTDNPDLLDFTYQYEKLTNKQKIQSLNNNFNKDIVRAKNNIIDTNSHDNKINHYQNKYLHNLTEYNDNN